MTEVEVHLSLPTERIGLWLGEQEAFQEIVCKRVKHWCRFGFIVIKIKVNMYVAAILLHYNPCNSVCDI